jgi:hypothetical protein
MVGVGGLTQKNAVYGYGWADAEGLGFGGGLYYGYDFGWLIGQLGFRIANDGGQSGNDFLFNGLLLQLPLVVKLDFPFLHLWRFNVQPLFGFYLNFPLGDANYQSRNPKATIVDEWETSLAGWLGGVSLGFRLGRGFVFAEVQTSGNFSTTIVQERSFIRSATLVNLGYQYYFKKK